MALPLSLDPNLLRTHEHQEPKIWANNIKLYPPFARSGSEMRSIVPLAFGKVSNPHPGNLCSPTVKETLDFFASA